MIEVEFPDPPEGHYWEIEASRPGHNYLVLYKHINGWFTSLEYVDQEKIAYTDSVDVVSETKLAALRILDRIEVRRQLDELRREFAEHRKGNNVRGS